MRRSLASSGVRGFGDVSVGCSDRDENSDGDSNGPGGNGDRGGESDPGPRTPFCSAPWHFIERSALAPAFALTPVSVGCSRGL